MVLQLLIEEHEHVSVHFFFENLEDCFLLEDVASQLIYCDLRSDSMVFRLTLLAPHRFGASKALFELLDLLNIELFGENLINSISVLRIKNDLLEASEAIVEENFWTFAHSFKHSTDHIVCIKVFIWDSRPLSDLYNYLWFRAWLAVD